MTRRLFPSFVALACLVGASAAHAQAQETAVAKADRLFREGRAALEANRFAEACPKLAESQKLDPGTGTLLALGLCHEANGETASAWRELTAVLEASQKRADRLAMAQKHLRALEPRLSRLTVNVADAPTKQSVAVKVDGEDLPQSRWATALPFDPGDHVIEATMPGAVPWKATTHLAGDGDSKIVTVPKLEAPPPHVDAPVAPPEPAPTKMSSGGTLRTAGWIVGGVGAAALGVGVITGALALHDHSDAHSLCPTSSCSSSAGVSDNNRAKGEAWASDFGLGVGALGLAAAAYLILTHPASSTSAGSAGAPKAELVPSAGPGSAGLLLRGVF